MCIINLSQIKQQVSSSYYTESMQGMSSRSLDYHPALYQYELLEQIRYYRKITFTFHKGSLAQ